MTKTTKMIIQDEHDLTKATVINHEGYVDTVHIEYGNGYYNKVSIDGNSNMIIEYKDGRGQGRISLPSGTCFDIYTAMQVLQKMGRNLTSDKLIYRDRK